MEFADERYADQRDIPNSYFNQHGRSIFRPRQMTQSIGENRRAWGLPKSTSVQALLQCLVRETSLREIRLGFPSRPETRFTWGTIPPFELALSLRSDAYLSHRSAMWLNGLTTDEPELIYVNTKMPMEFDFYLTHQMSEARHCERWRVSCPSSLDGDRLL